MAMSPSDPQTRIVANYQAFAHEAHGKSPHYEALAMSVAADTTIVGFLAGLPRPKRQPNLLFAVARYLLGEEADIKAPRGLLRPRGDDLAETMRTRRTQTNEAARCATL